MKPTHTNAESERKKEREREREREREKRYMRNDEVQSTARRTERLEGEPKVLQILMP